MGTHRLRQPHRLILAIGSTLNLPKSEVSGASPYWLDAVYTAATMELLAHQMDPKDRPNPDTCYLVGLLANFGTLIVGHMFPPQYESICRIQEPKLTRVAETVISAKQDLKDLSRQMTR